MLILLLRLVVFEQGPSVRGGQLTELNTPCRFNNFTHVVGIWPLPPSIFTELTFHHLVLDKARVVALSPSPSLFFTSRSLPPLHFYL